MMMQQHLPHASELPWLSDCWRKLMIYLGQEKLPHALLISGRDGLGKSSLAEAFAQTLFCANPDKKGAACEQCSDCRLLMAGTHPDFIAIEAETGGKQISVDSIRDLTSKLALKTHYRGNRVVIINPAEALNSASANSLLKTLEEPPENTVILLIAESSSTIAPTLVSRCQKIKLTPPKSRVASQWLRDTCPGEDPEILLALGNAKPLLALQNASPERIEQRRAVYDDWVKLAQGRDDPLQAGTRFMKYSLREVILWLTGWVADMIRSRSAPGGSELTNKDLQAGLQAEAQRLNLKQLFGFLDLLFRARKLLDTQANEQLLLEELLIEWSVLKRL